MFENENAAAAAAFLYALEPLSILYSTLILTETLFTLLVVASCFFLASYFRRKQALSSLILAALSLACSVYVRPVSYYLPVLVSLVLFPVLLLRYKRVKYLFHVAAFLVVSVGLSAAWQVRNKVETGYGGFSAISDINLYFYQAASVRAKVENLPFLEARRRMGYDDPDLYFAEHPEQLSWSNAQRYEFMGRAGAKIILSHPGVYAAVHMDGMVRILFDPGSVDFLKIFGSYPRSGGILGKVADQGLISVVLDLFTSNPLVFWTQIALFTLLAAYYVLALLGLFSRVCLCIWAKVTGAAVIVYFVAVSAGPQSYSRFRHPVMPFLCILAGCGLYLARRVDSRPAISDSDWRKVTGS
jgi:4-amino-4-deoxy-L-arabinose transferase-like glycosyltransferase